MESGVIFAELVLNELKKIILDKNTYAFIIRTKKRENKIAEFNFQKNVQK